MGESYSPPEGRAIVRMAQLEVAQVTRRRGRGLSPVHMVKVMQDRTAKMTQDEPQHCPKNFPGGSFHG
jgi:hypothetical protein